MMNENQVGVHCLVKRACEMETCNSSQSRNPVIVWLRT